MPGKTTLYNLELHKMVDGKWVHDSTVVWNVPFGLCRGELLKRRSYKEYFEFYKIVPSKKTT